MERFERNPLSALLLICALSGCSGSDDALAPPRPQQAGQPLDPLRTAAHIAAARGSAALGDEAGVQAHIGAIGEDYRKVIKLADPARRVDRESARVIARSVPGVRSAAWVDGANLLVMVDGAAARSYATIDTLCVGMEPLGDTLGVVVHLQNAVARSGADLDVLSRNCQLAPGDRAFLHRDRRMDAVAAEHRAVHRAVQSQSMESAERRRLREESERVLAASTPEL